MNPYREAADEVESTWRQRASGIRPVPANLPKGGIPIPPADEVLLALVEEAERQRARRLRQMWRTVLISIAFVAAAFTIVYVITKVAP